MMIRSLVPLVLVALTPDVGLAEPLQPDAFAADVNRAVALWRSSCPVSTELGECVCVRVAKLANHCSTRKRRIALARRPGPAARARSELEAALATYALTPALRQDPGARAVAATARFYLAEAHFEATLEVRFPQGLDFSPARPNAAARSKERFMKFIEEARERSERATAAYRAIAEDADAPAELRIAALARGGEVFDRFAELLATAEIPRDVRSGRYAPDAIRAYCDQLRAERDPIRARASSAFALCLERAAAAGVNDVWRRRCTAGVQGESWRPGAAGD